MQILEVIGNIVEIAFYVSVIVWIVRRWNR